MTKPDTLTVDHDEAKRRHAVVGRARAALTPDHDQEGEPST